MNSLSNAYDPRVPPIIKSLEELRAQIEALQIAIEGIENGVIPDASIPQSKIIDLVSDLTNIQNSITAIINKNTSQDSEITDLWFYVNQIRDYLDIDNLSPTFVKIKEWMNTIMDTFDTIVALYALYNAVNNGLTSLQNAFNTQQQQYQQLDDTVADQTTQLETIDNTLADNEVRFNEILGEQSAMQGELVSHETRITNTEALVSAANVDLAANDAHDIVQDGLISANTAAIAGVSASAAATAASLAAVTAALIALGLFGGGNDDPDLGNIASRLSDLEDQVQSLADTVLGYSNDIASIQAVNSSQQSDIDLLKARFTAGRLKLDNFANGTANGQVLQYTIGGGPAYGLITNSNLTYTSGVFDLGSNKIKTSASTFVNGELVTKDYVDQQIGTGAPSNLSQINVDSNLIMGSYKVSSGAPMGSDLNQLTNKQYVDSQIQAISLPSNLITPSSITDGSISTTFGNSTSSFKMNIGDSTRTDATINVYGRLSNVTDPSNPQDSVTLNYLTTNYSITDTSKPYLDGLVGWFDSTDLRTITYSSDAKVLNWKSKDPYMQGGSLYQGTSGNMPTIVNNTYSGTAGTSSVMYFSGSSWFKNNLLYSDPKVQNSLLFNVTCFVVWRSSVSISSTYRAKLISNDNLNYGRTFGFDNRRLDVPMGTVSTVATSNLCLFTNSGPIRFIDSSSQEPSIVSNTLYCTWYNYYNKNDGIITTSSYPQYCNAWHMGTKYIDNARCDNTQGSAQFTLGANASNSTENYSGDIAEIILYHRQLTYNEMSFTVNYLKNKYGFNFTY